MGGWCDIYETNSILNSVVVEVEVWVELGNINFNVNLVESWESFILNSFMPSTQPPTHPNFELGSKPYDVLNKTAFWYLQENMYLVALKMILSKDDQSKSPNFKSNSSQITIFKKLKKKIIHKSFFQTQK